MATSYHIEIKRPKDLALASAVADDDAIVIDQGEAGVKRTSLGQIRTQMQGAVFAVGLGLDDGDPNGRIAGSPGHLHFRDTGVDDIVELWFKRTGANTTDGWKLLLRGKIES